MISACFWRALAHCRQVLLCNLLGETIHLYTTRQKYSSLKRRYCPYLTASISFTVTDCSISRGILDRELALSHKQWKARQNTAQEILKIVVALMMVFASP